MRGSIVEGGEGKQKQKNAGYRIHKTTIHENENLNGHLLHIWTRVSMISKALYFDWLYLSLQVLAEWHCVAQHTNHGW